VTDLPFFKVARGTDCRGLQYGCDTPPRRCRESFLGVMALGGIFVVNQQVPYPPHDSSLLALRRPRNEAFAPLYGSILGSLILI
jgi:hypothetical protein